VVVVCFKESVVEDLPAREFAWHHCSAMKSGNFMRALCPAKYFGVGCVPSTESQNVWGWKGPLWVI